MESFVTLAESAFKDSTQALRDTKLVDSVSSEAKNAKQLTRDIRDLSRLAFHDNEAFHKCIDQLVMGYDRWGKRDVTQEYAKVDRQARGVALDLCLIKDGLTQLDAEEKKEEENSTKSVKHVVPRMHSACKVACDSIATTMERIAVQEKELEAAYAKSTDANVAKARRALVEDIVDKKAEANTRHQNMLTALHDTYAKQGFARVEQVKEEIKVQEKEAEDDAALSEMLAEASDSDY